MGLVGLDVAVYWLHLSVSFSWCILPRNKNAANEKGDNPVSPLRLFFWLRESISQRPEFPPHHQAGWISLYVISPVIRPHWVHDNLNPVIKSIRFRYDWREAWSDTLGEKVSAHRGQGQRPNVSLLMYCDLQIRETFTLGPIQKSLYLLLLLAPSGALVVIMVYYIHTQRSSNPLFQIFQILQIRRWKWKWKDPTCAIFLKSMGFKDIKYDIPVYQM